uniref:Uncharacterized protein n=1 Tax=Lepeophtheirus salmonis TaxID=72036 RepID=A0A0K2U870_LEPSM
MFIGTPFKPTLIVPPKPFL